MADPNDPLAGLGTDNAPPTAPDSTTGIIGGFQPGRVPPRHMGGAPIGEGHPNPHIWLSPTVGTPINDTAYKSGDEWQPLNDPKSIIDLQKQLIAAGLINAKDVRPGVWDTKAASAYRTVLAFANASGTYAHAAMQYLVENPSLGDLQGPQKPVHQITNPADAKEAFRQAAQKLTGGDLPAGEQGFADWYASKERQSAAAADAASAANAGGTVAAAPSLGTAAEDFVREHNKEQTLNYGAASRMLQFYDMLRSPT